MGFGERISYLWGVIKPTSEDVRIFLIVLAIIVFGLRYTDIIIILQFFLVFFLPPLAWVAYKFPKPMAMLVIAVAIEQSALYFITQSLLRDDKIFYEYLDSLPNPYLAEGYKNDCKEYRFAYIYWYELCTFKGGGKENHEYNIRIKHPPAYITLLSPDYSDRFTLSGSSLAWFDAKHNITLIVRMSPIDPKSLLTTKKMPPLMPGMLK